MTQTPVTLQTPHLLLEPWVPAHIVALLEAPERFGVLSGRPAADGLRDMYASDDVSPDWLAALRRYSEPDPWRHGFRVVHRERGLVIGGAGYKGPPSDGMVEIAYGIAPGFRGNGYATEAARALIDYASDTPGVVLIRAHTLPEPNASTRVLGKCGLVHVGAFEDPDDGPVWRWERPAVPVADR